MPTLLRIGPSSLAVLYTSTCRPGAYGKDGHVVGQELAGLTDCFEAFGVVDLGVDPVPDRVEGGVGDALHVPAVEPVGRRRDVSRAHHPTSARVVAVEASVGDRHLERTLALEVGERRDARRRPASASSTSMLTSAAQGHRLAR